LFAKGFELRLLQRCPDFGGALALSIDGKKLGILLLLL
jgi:hypothetical protein